jgi:hypothetical protein
VRGVDGNTACFFFWSSIDLVVCFSFAAEFFDRTVAIAAVRVVLPWSTWPMVPTLTCGLVRSNSLLPF